MAKIATVKSIFAQSFDQETFFKVRNNDKHTAMTFRNGTLTK